MVEFYYEVFYFLFSCAVVAGLGALISARLGYGWAWGLLMVVPIVSLLLVWIAGFREWPSMQAGQTPVSPLRPGSVSGGP